MAGTTDAVYGLLEEIWTPALESAKGELAEMEELFRKDFPEGEFASWDWWYYAEKVRKQKYALDEEMLRPYFSLENVQGGIFFLANRLYGITFRPIVVPLYHPRRSLTRCSTSTSRIWACSISITSRATERARARGAATTWSRPTRTGSVWRPWCRSSATSRARRGAIPRC